MNGSEKMKAVKGIYRDVKAIELNFDVGVL